MALSQATQIALATIGQGVSTELSRTILTTDTTVGFFGATAVTRPASYTQTYSTATRTHSNLTSAALTVTDGAGTNDGTIPAITNNASTITAVQELADQINKIVVDITNIKGVLNQVIDDLQTLGLLQ